MGIPLKYNIRNLLVRRVSTLMTGGGIALVVAVFVVVMALVAGLRRAITISGSVDNVVMVRKGATTETVSGVGKDQFDALKFLGTIERDKDGNPLASPELTIQEFFERNGGGRDNIVVRGVLPVALRVHEKVHVIEGRMFNPSVNEVIMGKQLVGRYKGCALGSTIKFGRNKWKVVGVFEADGSSFESEAWSDLHDLQSDARRGDSFSAARIKAAPGADLSALKKRAQDDPRINLDASTEPEYYAAQSTVADQMRALGVIMAVVMAIGAVFGAMNTMYAAVAGRTAEIGTLRALGFNRASVMGCFVIESLILAVSAGIVGVIIALPINGLSTSIGNSTTFSTMAFSFRVTPAIAMEAILFAAVMGVLGGLLPARQAMRMPVVDALRRA